ncbi:MAG: ATP-binding cassette domain-containing protein [Verrucomicrobiota bacterium]|nr:ATP-binding cassette domain-containing protein [Limisphaera sp.]MDW8382864.1 ATP-binding cassette domain-containing protein [Verrucomicrobiota bacterium]
MPVIQVKSLTRTFRVYKKQPGLWGAVRGLFRRRYEIVHAVQGISFDIEAGEFVGFLGPNGAGKTTTLKMLAGLLHPSAGSAQVLGYIPWHRPDAYRRQFALLLGQKNQLWWDLPARESFALNAAIYDLPKRTWETRAMELCEHLGVRDKLDVVVRELSLGERMKLELVAVLLHQPRVLFLDEPTLGLDVVAQKTVRDFLRHYNRQAQTTILLTSHDMADIEELCPRVIIIDHGRIMFDGPLGEIQERYANFKVVTIRCQPHAPMPEPKDIQPWGEIVEISPPLIRLRVPRERVISTCKALLDQLPVQDLDIHEVPIEEVIRNLFSRSQSVVNPSPPAEGPTCGEPQPNPKPIPTTHSEIEKQSGSGTPRPA